MTLYRLEAGDGEVTPYPEVCIHRGYVYYVIPFQSTMKLQRMKLGSKEAETVYEMTGDRQNLYRIKAYGNHIFFQAGNFSADNIDINASIFRMTLIPVRLKSSGKCGFLLWDRH